MPSKYYTEEMEWLALAARWRALTRKAPSSAVVKCSKVEKAHRSMADWIQQNRISENEHVEYSFEWYNTFKLMKD